MFHWCHHLLGISPHFSFIEIWIELKLKGLSFFVFSISSPAPFLIVTFVAVFLTWTFYFVVVKSTSSMHICALLRSAPDIDTPPFPHRVEVLHPEDAMQEGRYTETAPEIQR